MVGIIILKDFETGSYSRVRITAYEDDSFSNIGNGDFSSCVVEPDKGTFAVDYKSCDHSRVVTMAEAFKLTEDARRFWYSNREATELEFCFSTEESKFRIHSTKDGVYSPPDLQNLFKGDSFYKLCGEFKEDSFSQNAVLCDTLNYSVQRLYNTSEAVYAVAGVGVYINLVPFADCRGALSALAVSGKIKTLIKSAAKLHGININPCLSMPEEMEYADEFVSRSGHRLINQFRNCKIKVCKRVYDILKNNPEHFIVVLTKLCNDPEIKRLTKEFSLEFEDFCSKFYDYGYLEAKSHTRCITVREALAILSDTPCSKEISSGVSARSANLKFQQKLPGAHYYGSDGRAYWED